MSVYLIELKFGYLFTYCSWSWCLRTYCCCCVLTAAKVLMSVKTLPLKSWCTSWCMLCRASVNVNCRRVQPGLSSEHRTLTACEVNAIGFVACSANTGAVAASGVGVLALSRAAATYLCLLRHWHIGHQTQEVYSSISWIQKSAFWLHTHSTYNTKIEWQFRQQTNQQIQQIIKSLQTMKQLLMATQLERGHYHYAKHTHTHTQ